ncbi:hypothetical protein [Nostoc sp.]|uniref:hypothetical protein n=1 Tax=Nostoc sp. TaxID=1180 RepID=UPI002FFBB9AB
MLGYPSGSCYVPQTPLASSYSPLGILRQALAFHQWEKRKGQVGKLQGRSGSPTYAGFSFWL